MRLHAYLTQALIPSPTPSPALELAQMPGFQPDEVEDIIEALEEKNLPNFVKELDKRQDERKVEVEKAAKKWGNLDVVDTAFKGVSSVYFLMCSEINTLNGFIVIGERIVTPSAIVHLVVKLRISPPLDDNITLQGEKVAQSNSKAEEEKDNEFLISKRDSEESANIATNRAAHAPYWPGV